MGYVKPCLKKKIKTTQNSQHKQTYKIRGLVFSKSICFCTTLVYYLAGAYAHPRSHQTSIMFLVSSKAIQRTQARQTDINSLSLRLGPLHSACSSTRHGCPLHTGRPLPYCLRGFPASLMSIQQGRAAASLHSTAPLGCFPRSQSPWRSMAPFYRKINKGIEPIPQTGTDSARTQVLPAHQCATH